MQDKTTLTITAILAILVIEGIALLKGVNGVFLGLALCIISALAGYEIKGLREKLNK